MIKRLSEIESNELEVVNMAIEEFVGETSVAAWSNWSLGGSTMDAINRTFKYDSIEEIVAALENEVCNYIIYIIYL